LANFIIKWGPKFGELLSWIPFCNVCQAFSVVLGLLVSVALFIMHRIKEGVINLVKTGVDVLLNGTGLKKLDNNFALGPLATREILYGMSKMTEHTALRIVTLKTKLYEYQILERYLPKDVVMPVTGMLEASSTFLASATGFLISTAAGVG